MEAAVEMTNTSILCISSIDWDFIWQGHQEIMSTLAAQGNRVLFIENTGVRAPGWRDLSRIRQRLRNWRRGIGGIRQERKNLYVYSPIVVPLPYSRIARFINRQILVQTTRQWMRATGFCNPVIWTFLPTQLTIDLADAIDHKLLIYYCIDSFSESSMTARRIRRSEEQLIRRADLVFVTSKRLETFCQQFRRDVHLFPFGVSLKIFENAEREPRVPADMAALGRPRIGYVGGIHKWVDQALVEQLARRRPDYQFVFVGPLQIAKTLLAHCPNVHFLGNKSASEIPHYIRQFDCCIIPYRITEYTRSVYPTKLNEYLALGKPVVSTPLPEVERFNREQGPLVGIADGVDAFDSALHESLQNGQSESEVARRMAVARSNGWEARIREMSALTVDMIERKRVLQEQSWRVVVVHWYRRARRRVVWVAVAVISVYVLLFHSPVLWMVASPLKLSQPAGMVDAIVVFAGGVGESGMAGQGYQERVNRAVSLYRDGYASHMVFSSGYRYAIHEVRVMQALAVSLGVPASAIILEEKSTNTYENVLLTTQVLEANDWTSVLVVSSPYHMRRVSLVYNRSAPQVDVTYTPVLHSRFYERSGRIQLKQYRAILHEYAAIVYYWAQGWI